LIDKSERVALLRVIHTADGGCEACVEGLLAELEEKLPTYSWRREYRKLFRRKKKRLRTPAHIRKAQKLITDTYAVPLVERNLHRMSPLMRLHQASKLIEDVE
jgi:hypothetical protein